MADLEQSRSYIEDINNRVQKMREKYGKLSYKSKEMINY